MNTLTPEAQKILNEMIEDRFDRYSLDKSTFESGVIAALRNAELLRAQGLYSKEDILEILETHENPDYIKFEN